MRWIMGEEFKMSGDKLSKGALWSWVESSWRSNRRLRCVDVKTVV